MWLKGDLHSHSKYSDGDSAVNDVLEEAKNRAGLQFVSITDHDTHFRDHPDRITTWYDSAYKSSSGLTVLNGVEWTTSDGHANVWSTHPYDYSAIWAANRSKDPGSAIQLAHDQGALFSYNHPVTDYGSNDWSLPTSQHVDCVEIWNGPDEYSSNFKATFKFWDGLLQQYSTRITAVSGSDMHELHGGSSNVLKLGKPRLWVLADDASPDSILDAVEHGRATISESGGAPRLELAADRGGDGTYETRLGDIVPLSFDANVRFKMTLDGGGSTRPVQALAQTDLDRINRQLESRKDYSDTLDKICDEAHSDDYVLALIKNGLFYKAWLVDQKHQDVTVAVPVEGGTKSYYRAELYDNDERLAVTNPIYFNFTNVDHGTAGHDVLRGENASDALYASSGNDRLLGQGGKDALYGQAGNDRLTGGSDSDRLTGGTGNDVFDYDYVTDSKPGSANRDVILDFTGMGAAAGDRIDLATIDANTSAGGNQAFIFRGTGAFTGAGQVRVTASGTDTLIQANTGGSLAAEMEILVKDGTALHSQWVAEDFIL